MIDSHCHLTDPRLLGQLDQVLLRAEQAGVHRIITIGTDLQDSAAAVQLCCGRSGVRCAIGIHPNCCQNASQTDLEKLRQLQADPAVVALGEMGLDYFRNSADRELQKRFFHSQLQLAAELRLPVVIHCRQAVDDCLAILRDFPTVQAVFHCFTGTLDEGRRVLDAGYMVGFTGVVTFRNSQELRELARLVPAERFMVETDAPYLSPEPMRKQKINEPALVVHTATAIATARGVSVEEIDRMTTENAMRFFGWK